MTVDEKQPTTGADVGASTEPTVVAPLPEPEAQPGRLTRIFRSGIGPAITFALFIGVWYFFSFVLLSERRRFLMPPPHQVANEGFVDTDNLTEILTGLWQTTRVAFTGLAIAIVLGVALATVMSQAKWLENSVYPYAVVLQTVPIIALVPLIGLWFDYNFRSRVLVCVIIALFPIMTNTLFGLKSADAGHHDLFTLHGASRFTRLTKLMYPGAMPAMFTGFRISAGLAVIGAIVGDFFFRQGDPGIGRLLDIYRLNIETEMLYAAIFWSSMLGVAMFWSFGLFGSALTRKWHDSSLTKG